MQAMRTAVGPLRPNTPDADDVHTMEGGDSFALLNAWRDFMRARNLEEKTIHDYTQGVWRLVEHHDFAVHLLDMDEQHVVVFLASVSNHAAAKHQYAKGIRSFFRWARRRGWVIDDPSEYAMPRKPPKRRKERFEVAEIDALVEAANLRDPLRGWAILACLGLGTRRHEFVHLTRADLDWNTQTVHIRAETAKNRRERFIPMSPVAVEALRELEAMATGERLVPIQPNTFNHWVNQAAIDCGFPPGRKRRCHTLRATYASWLADDGAHPHVIRDLLGHESVSTTSDYMVIGNRAGAEAVASFGAKLRRDEATG